MEACSGSSNKAAIKVERFTGSANKLWINKKNEKESMTQETYFTISLCKLGRKTGKKKNRQRDKRGKVENEENSSHNNMRITQRLFLIRNKCGDELEWV